MPRVGGFDENANYLSIALQAMKHNTPHIRRVLVSDMCRCPTPTVIVTLNCVIFLNYYRC
jgi:hypothetical protein